MIRYSFIASFVRWDVSLVETMESMLGGANSFVRGAWCSAVWLVAASTYASAAAPTGNAIFCCKAGSYLKDLDPLTLNDDGDCLQCPVGQYTSGLNINRNCVPASRDTFVPAEGMPFSSACATDAFSNPPNSSSCTLCPAGKQMVRGAMTTTCEDCGVGTFQKHPGTEYCDDCVTGFYQDETGIPYCVGCIPGMYQGKEGEANCTTCPNGWSTTDNSVQEGGAPLVDECQRCQRGKSTNLKRGAAECVTCALGSYGLVAEYNCVLCPVGT